MKLALIFAFCSLAFTACNDFVFKLFADKMRSRGGFVAIIGVISTIMMCFTPTAWEPFGRTLAWGLAGGFFSVAANILLIEAMARQSAGLCSTIYRLNMVFVVAGAYLLLNEDISAMQWGGITLALLSIFAFFPYGGSVGFSRLGFVLVVMASMLRGGMSIVYKMSFQRGINQNSVAQITDACWIIGGLLYVLLRERDWTWLRDRNVLGLGTVSGLLVGAIVFCMAGSLNAGDASIVIPIAQMSFLVTFLLSFVFLHERITIPKTLALLLGAGAIVLFALC